MNQKNKEPFGGNFPFIIIYKINLIDFNFMISYKILFLDVLFPLNLEKIIYVDADQVS